MDDNGLGGLELKFDDELHGAPGHMLTAVDAKRHVLGSEESEPVPGENLVLSIDQNIQHMAEKALDAQVAKTGALHGTVVCRTRIRDRSSAGGESAVQSERSRHLMRSR